MLQKKQSLGIETILKENNKIRINEIDTLKTKNSDGIAARKM